MRVSPVKVLVGNTQIPFSVFESLMHRLLTGVVREFVHQLIGGANGTHITLFAEVPQIRFVTAFRLQRPQERWIKAQTVDPKLFNLFQLFADQRRFLFVDAAQRKEMQNLFRVASGAQRASAAQMLAVGTG